MSLLSATSTTDVVRAEDLYLWYPMEDGTLTDVATGSEFGTTTAYNGTAQNPDGSSTPTFHSDAGPNSNGAWEFDYGTGQEIDPGGFSFSGSPMTVSVLVTYENSGNAYAGIFGDYDGTSTTDIQRYNNKGGSWQTYADGIPGSNVLGGNFGNRSSHSWVLYTFTYSSSTLTAYWDAVEQDTESINNYPQPSNNQFVIARAYGNAPSNAESWDGYMKDFRIYRDVLSQSEIQEIYNLHLG